MPQDKLRILGMIFHAYHGLEHFEMQNGQRFEVDVEMEFDTHKAAQTDKIKDTIDVRQVYARVQNLFMSQRFYLIETVCQRIAGLLLDEFAIDCITVRVRKPFAPLGGLADGTELEITRSRT